MSYSVCAGLMLYEVLDTPDYMGGIIGYAENNCSVSRCENQGTLQCGASYCGGIAGWLSGSSITSCYNRCIVKTKNNYVGGIVGKCSNSQVQYCLNVASASSFSGVTGGIEGAYTDDCTNKGNYTLAEAAGTAATCTAFTQEQLASGTIAKALNDALKTNGGTAIWRQALGTDFCPSLSDTTKTIVTSTTDKYSIVQNISSAGDFVMAVSNPLAQVSLQNDIDMANGSFMLATETYPFKGTIEGNGYTISNCSYESSSTDNVVSSTEQGHNVALFPWATKATFKNFTIDNFQITQKDETGKGALKTQAFLVGTSNNCIYDGITIRHSSIPLNSDKDYKIEVGALIANSKNDAVSNCSTTSDCRLEGASYLNNTYVGGLVGLANSSTFTLCHNGATVWANDNDEGGICSYCEDCSFERCLNTGSITGQKKVAGIVGAAVDTQISNCVNTGTIDDDENTAEDYRSGIVAEITANSKNGSSVLSCLNFGTIKNAKDYSGTIVGAQDDNLNINPCFFYCQYNGDTRTSLGDYTVGQVTSGYYALATNMYQSIDNAPFATKYPVPIPAAGTVYENVLCDGTVSYSNIFQSEAAHTSNADAIGLCSICGKTYKAPTTITINNATDLCNLAYGTNHGVDYSKAVIKMANDIDMDGVTDYSPIGIYSDHPFCGTFDGQGYRIKNLAYKSYNVDGVGIFGCVSGSDTKIKNLIVDGSCSIDGGVGTGVAGIVGSQVSASGSACKLTITACANEADITGSKNVAGIVGGVYNNDNSTLIIEDCYNSGHIKGYSDDAAIVGYGLKNLTANRCLNAGTVEGTVSDYAMFYYDTPNPGTVSFASNYQWTTAGADANATSTTVSQFMNGSICDALKKAAGESSNLWGQNLGTDVIPCFHSLGIYHQRTMANTWGTVVLPYTAVSNSDVQFYEVKSCNVSSATGKLVLEPVVAVAANVPCFFKKLDSEATSVCMTKSGDLTIYAGDKSNIKQTTQTAEWNIVGTYETLENIKDVYYLASNKLWRADTGITVKPYRAYLTYTNVNSAKSLAIFVDEGNEVDQIGEISADGNISFYDQPVYNLAGQRMTGSAKGIVIIGGKKYLKK